MTETSSGNRRPPHEGGDNDKAEEVGLKLVQNWGLLISRKKGREAFESPTISPRKCGIAASARPWSLAWGRSAERGPLYPVGEKQSSGLQFAGIVVGSIAGKRRGRSTRQQVDGGSFGRK